MTEPTIERRIDVTLESEPTDDEALVERALRRTIARAPARATAEESAEDVWEGLKHFITGTQLVVRTRTRKTVRWPLFYLGCPDAEGAELSVRLRSSSASNRTWSLSLYGVGFERYRSLSSAMELEATAKRGQQCLVYVRNEVDVVAYDLVHLGRDDTRGTSIEVVPQTFALGTVDLGATPWACAKPATKRIELEQRGLKPDAHPKYEEEQSYTKRSDLVLSAASEILTFGPSFGYEVTTSVTQSATLPGGADWQVMTPDRCPGMWVARAGAS